MCLLALINKQLKKKQKNPKKPKYIYVNKEATESTFPSC